MSMRRGVSLAELLLVMSISSIVLTISVGLIHRVMHTQSRTRAFYDGERAALRLSRQFRQDIHAARSVQTDADALEPNVLVQLETSDEQTVEYRRSKAGLERLALEKGETRSREEYSVPSDMNVVFRQEEPPRVIVLSIAPSEPTAGEEQPTERSRTKPISLHVEARLGVDRFDRVAAAQEDAP